MLQGFVAAFKEQISGCVLNYPAKIVASREADWDGGKLR